ncbi:hypothetical protein [Botrimarina sp.]|uniref:hypothetical protein n=1 Tax=Botrimarina sp. TaxID=2795802 RepID=UPI0032EC1886
MTPKPSSGVFALAGAAACLVAAIAHAQPFTDGSRVTIPQAATQNFVIPGGTPFNPDPTAADIVLTVTAVGASTFTVDLSGPTPLLVDGSFFGVGADPTLGRFELVTGPDYGFDPMTMTFENLVGDVPGGDFTADVVAFTVPNYGVNLIDAGANLIVPDSFFFTGAAYDGLPPSAGITLFADPFEANPPTGPDDPVLADGSSSYLPAFVAGGGPFAGYSTSRSVTTLPEPATSLTLAAGLAGFAIGCRRRCATC